MVFLTVLTKISSTAFNKRGRRTFFFLTDLGEKVLSFPPLNIMLHISLLLIADVMLRYVPLISSFFPLKDFIMKG